MNCTRSAGYAGSSGTYAPPAFKTPSTPTTRSSEPLQRNPTRTSGPTPSDRSRYASPFARRSSSAYDNDSPHTPPPPGPDPSRTCASNRSCKHPATPKHRHVFTHQRASLVLRNEWQSRRWRRRGAPRRHAAGFRSARATGEACAVEEIRVVVALDDARPIRCRPRSPAARSWSRSSACRRDAIVTSPKSNGAPILSMVNVISTSGVRLRSRGSRSRRTRLPKVMSRVVLRARRARHGRCEGARRTGRPGRGALAAGRCSRSGRRASEFSS